MEPARLRRRRVRNVQRASETKGEIRCKWLFYVAVHVFKQASNIEIASSINSEGAF